MAAPFHQSRKYFTSSSYTYDPYTPMYGTNSGGIYEAENSINIHNKVKELSQKLDRLLSMRHSPTSPLHVCDIYLSPNHLISECPAAYRSWKFVHEQTYPTPTQTNYYNPYSNTYSLGWKNYSNFYETSQPATIYEPGYPEETYTAYKYQNIQQPSSSAYSSTFKENILHMLETHTQSISKIEIQLSQLTTAFNSWKEEELSGQPIK